METCDHIIAAQVDWDELVEYVYESEVKEDHFIHDPFLHCPRCGVSCDTAKRLVANWKAKEAEREAKKQQELKEKQERDAFWKDQYQKEYDEWTVRVMSKIQTKYPPHPLPPSLDAAIEAYKAP